MRNADNWYSQKTLSELGAFFVVPQKQETWFETAGVITGVPQYTQLQLLDFVSQKLRSRSLQVVPIQIKSRHKRFALICSNRERRLDQGIKRGFAFVGLNQDGSLKELNRTNVSLIGRHVNIMQKDVNGYLVWRGVLDDDIVLG